MTLLSSLMITVATLGACAGTDRGLDRDAAPLDARAGDVALPDALTGDAAPADTASPDTEASIPPLTIVAAGQALAHVVVGDDASAQVRAAAQTLVDYVEQSTGVTLPLITDDTPGGQGIAIHVGKTAASERKDLLPADLDEDGFVIEANEQNRSLIICGPSDWGTEFGVYELLERRVGVRWLLPGPDGTHVPALERIDVPVGRRVDQPAFLSRQFSGLKTAAERTWARFNRMHGRISFHHNLLRLFPPESYTQSHPHFFPMKDGQTRYLPPDNNTRKGWQPCFSAEGLVDEAAKNIIAYFDAHPEATSYSLGVNDNSGHCRCPACLARVPQQKNFLGRDDYSDLYYGWAYQVIEKVLAVHPDKRFGALAYSEVAAPPQNALVHPRMIPFMTYDRMKWIDPQVEQAGHDATVGWAQKAPALGWYDYLYGTPYCLPRVYFSQAAKTLRYGQQHGVAAQYAELYPNWGEGPKPYILLRLRWNPQLDPDRLLRDWCEHAVGEDAAPYLEQYYRIWERFWTSDILASRWFRRAGQYLPFSRPSYLADVREQDIAQSRLLLETAIAKARTAKQQARAELLEQAFQYYEASALAYRGDHRSLAGNTAQEVLAAIGVAEEAMCMAEKRRHLALTVFPQDPLLKHPIAIDGAWGDALGGTHWGQTGLWLALERAAEGDIAVRQKLQQIAATSACDNVRSTAALVLDIALDESNRGNRVANPSFDSGSGAAASDWSRWNKIDPATGERAGTIGRSQSRSRSGDYSMLCDGIYRGGPHQTIDEVTPGRYLVTAWAYVSAAVPSATLQLSLVPRDAAGKDLPSINRTLTPEAGRWLFVPLLADLPAQSTSARIVAIANGYQAGGKVYWDDVALHRIDPPTQ